MHLKRFKVTTFRSVDDSGWLEVDGVTALIGINESGKTNLLLPLWKLNPAREGEIQPTSDYPKKMFGEIRDGPGDYCFIAADFETGEHRADVAEITGIDEESAAVVRVCRYFDGKYAVEFPGFERPSITPLAEVRQVLIDLKRRDSVDAGTETGRGIQGAIAERGRFALGRCSGGRRPRRIEPLGRSSGIGHPGGTGQN